jgi:hypothetical protein
VAKSPLASAWQCSPPGILNGNGGMRSHVILLQNMIFKLIRHFLLSLVSMLKIFLLMARLRKSSRHREVCQVPAVEVVFSIGGEEFFTFKNSNLARAIFP